MGELNTFPVSYKVQGQRIVIIGGGEEALSKARLVVKTTASVVIVSQSISVNFEGLGQVLEQPFAPEVLDGAALVFVAEHSADAERRRSWLVANISP